MSKGRNAYILIGIPKVLRRPFKKAAKFALIKCQRYFKFRRQLTIVLIYDPTYRLGKRVLIHAYPLESRDSLTIIMHIGLLLFQQPSRLFIQQAIAQSVVHEISHIVHGEKERPLVIDSIIEEGLSCFVETLLVAPPSYLAKESLTPRKIRNIWQKIGENLNKRLRLIRPKSLTREDIPEEYYCLGFYIISSYFQTYPHLSLAKLLKVPTRSFFAFAKKLFEQRETVGREKREVISHKLKNAPPDF